MTLPTPQPPNAGWYDDPEEPGQLRYFDGILWTNHTTRREPVRPPAAVVAEPVAAPPAHGIPGPSVADRTGHGPQGYGAGMRASQPGAAVLEDGTRLASYGQRIAAFLLDGLIKLLLALIFGGWAAYLAVRDQMAKNWEAAKAGKIVTPDLAAADVKWLMVYFLIVSVIGLVYSVAFLTRRGATPGKAAVGISVRRVDRPGPIDVNAAVARYAIPFITNAATAVPLLSAALTGLWLADHAMPLLQPQRRALHDIMAGTVVVMGAQPRAEANSETG